MYLRGIATLLVLVGCGDDPMSIAVCSRGDRAELAETLRGGTLEVRFLDKTLAVVGEVLTASTERSTPVPDQIPSTATQIRVDAFAANSSVVAATGVADIDGRSQCVCLAAPAHSIVACEAVTCQVVGDSCRFLSNGTPVDRQRVTFGENRDARITGVTLDTSIREDQPDTAAPSEPRLLVDTEPHKRALVRFELAMPATTVVDSATLWLTLCVDCQSDEGQITAYALLESWDENATWTHRTRTDTWATPGAGSGSRAQNDSGSQDQLEVPGATVGLELDPQLVQGWLTQPETNHGVILLQTGDTRTGLDLFASEALNLGGRIYLEIEYHFE